MRIHQAEVGLIDQRSRLQAVIRALVGNVALGNPMELPVYERDQPLEGGLVALPPFLEQSGDLGGMAGNAIQFRPFRPFKLQDRFPASWIEGSPCR